MYRPKEDPILKKLEQAAIEKAKRQAEEDRHRKLEERQLKLLRQDVIWNAINTMIALAALLLALFK